MKTACVITFFALFCLSACSTVGSEYAKAHPALTQAQRQILINGKIPGGLAVDGMTKEQVRLAIGNPVSVERYNGGEAWIYLHEKMSGNTPPGQETASRPGPDAMGPRHRKNEKTTIFFQGDRATHTQISEERL